MINHRCNTGLLQHDFRKPHIVRIGVFSPGQIALVGVIPLQQPAAKLRWRGVRPDVSTRFRWHRGCWELYGGWCAPTNVGCKYDAAQKHRTDEMCNHASSYNQA